jgi:phage tail sheath protein FI
MGINPIIWRNGKALIYGDHTAFQTYISDYNYIHVRELLNTIEIECRAVLQGYVFKYNNAQTRSEITNKLTPILDAMKNSGALVKYTFQFDENNNPDSVIDRSFAIVDIGVWISKTAEKIIARITVNKLSEN